MNFLYFSDPQDFSGGFIVYHVQPFFTSWYVAFVRMLGSIISLESFIELCNHSATDLHSLLVKITSHSAVQGINGLDLFGEILFNNLAFVILTKWKPLLFISTMAFCTFRLLQKTCMWICCNVIRNISWKRLEVLWLKNVVIFRYFFRPLAQPSILFISLFQFVAKF